MKYASQISEIINAFSPAPLQKDQMEEFYCKDTMEYRTGDKYFSPIEDIYDICRNPEESSACLLLGHRGCGKSTELNRLSERLAANGYYVKIFNCVSDYDLFSFVYSDLVILMGEALLEIAKDLDCEVETEVLEKIRNFWCEGTETMTAQNSGTVSLEAGLGMETKGILAGLLNVLAQIKTDLKYNEETRKEYRRKISVRSSEWIGILGYVAEK